MLLFKIPLPHMPWVKSYAETLLTKRLGTQRAKKVVPDSPGLVDFVIRLVNSVLNLPNGQGKFFLQKNCEINSAHQNNFGAS